METPVNESQKAHSVLRQPVSVERLASILRIGSVAV